MLFFDSFSLLLVRGSGTPYACSSLTLFTVLDLWHQGHPSFLHTLFACLKKLK